MIALLLSLISAVFSIDDKCAACTAIAVSDQSLLFFFYLIFFKSLVVDPTVLIYFAGGAGAWAHECKQFLSPKFEKNFFSCQNLEQSKLCYPKDFFFLKISS